MAPFEWDERKRAASLAKHGVDFRIGKADLRGPLLSKRPDDQSELWRAALAAPSGWPKASCCSWSARGVERRRRLINARAGKHEQEIYAFRDCRAPRDAGRGGARRRIRRDLRRLGARADSAIPQGRRERSRQLRAGCRLAAARQARDACRGRRPSPSPGSRCPVVVPPRRPRHRTRINAVLRAFVQAQRTIGSDRRARSLPAEALQCLHSPVSRRTNVIQVVACAGASMVAQT